MKLADLFEGSAVLRRTVWSKRGDTVTRREVARPFSPTETPLPLTGPIVAKDVRDDEAQRRPERH
jgi:hypothetical protein